MNDERKTQCQRIVAELKRAGSRGRTSLELSRIALRYGSRIHDLRKQGWKINVAQWGRMFKYRLSGQDL